MRSTKLAAGGLVLVAGLGLTACGSDGKEAAPSSSAPATEVTAPPVTTAEGAGTATNTQTAAGAVKVSANTASEEELKAALEAAGVPNAAKWVDEIVEYRPYPADDPTLARLRQKIAKYNPGPDVIEKIVSVLTP